MRNFILISFLAISIYPMNIMAAIYYVKPNGNDSADGLSHASAWKTIDKVNSFNFSAGDDVYLYVDGSWKSQLRVTWNGTSTNPVIIGSYYLNNSKETVGVPSGSSKPTLVGGYPLVNVTGAVPVGPRSGMVTVSANYVTVQNIKIVNSSGVGIILNPGFHNAIFENNEVDTTAGGSILFARTTYSNIMRNNKIRKCDQAWKDGNWISNTWQVCNGAIGSKNNIIENNLITESYGEGIVAFAPGANNNVIRGNRIVLIRTVGIYIDNGANNTIENNIVVGDSTGGTPPGTAFGLNVEDYTSMNNATGNVFRNNLSANSNTCFWVGMEPDARSKGYKVGGSFLGNTCVGGTNSIRNYVTEAQIESFDIANNIFFGMSNTDCLFPSSANAHFNNNLWHVKPSNTVCQSTADIIADPMLQKQTGWDALNHNNIPTAADFTPNISSMVFGNGISNNGLTNDFNNNIRPIKPAIGAIDTNSLASTQSITTPVGITMNIIYGQ